jgi:hypothetical protein
VDFTHQRQILPSESAKVQIKLERRDILESKERQVTYVFRERREFSAVIADYGSCFERRTAGRTFFQGRRGLSGEGSATYKARRRGTRRREDDGPAVGEDDMASEGAGEERRKQAAQSLHRRGGWFGRRQSSDDDGDLLTAIDNDPKFRWPSLSAEPRGTTDTFAPRRQTLPPASQRTNQPAMQFPT